MVLTRCAGAVLVVFAVTGCSGGQNDRVFEATDATRVAAVRPVTPNWTWQRATAEPEPDPSASKSSDPLVVELQRRMAPLAGSGDAANTWRDNDKLGNLAVGVYGSAQDAHEAMAAMNEFSRAWGERSGDVTKDEQVDDLGDEAWRLWVGGSGTQVTYHWRRENLVVEAHVHCFGSCPSDVDAATRTWVDAIDAAAQVGA